jgi:division protein CdvB (Snf7/Vps24/ESCRT-III family)
MDKKEEFKSFVRKNPSFADHVQNKNTTWQELYELWDMYGEDDKVFSKYQSTSSTDLNSIISGIKNINMDNVKKNLNSIEKGIRMFQDFIKKEDVKPSYEPRPVFKRFED